MTNGGAQVSPDGRWLTLQGSLPNDAGRGVLLVSTETGAVRLAAPHPEIRSGPLSIAFTPDSKRILYARHVNPGPWALEDHELYWVPVEGGEPRFTGIRMSCLGAPSLNPDGKRLLFSTYETNTELWVLRNLPLN